MSNKVWFITVWARVAIVVSFRRLADQPEHVGHGNADDLTRRE